ncbi:twin-arginine translocase TatA/TatE family subunit [Candidatus Tachikawaea gelatinosa]|uniref:Sec-independent protein translocase protein TatA n=1 Tax=Candidatus Tachikawaea gelatinosa TaxID=1410383 RepID=A0A090AL02_9ENTR|nr:twin-arginine translocase TatA/TatE family subunit [Candidatus Tachikawaea gelatinosa]BAP58284.1 Sec-independent protein translocaseprotein TatA [Candidatus Tachikawaea gelatinosa]
MGKISIGKLLIVAVIILLVFGTKRLRNLGSDLGTSIKDFKKAMREEDVQDHKKNHINKENINYDKNHIETEKNKIN